MSAYGGWRQRDPAWQSFTVECVWCGEDFTYFSAIRESRPVVQLSYCCRKCIAEARWEGLQMPSRQVLEQLYVHDVLSGPTIANMFGVHHRSIYDCLKKYGIQRRVHTAQATCRKCGAHVLKRFHSRKDNSGMRILFGTLCLEHQREEWRRIQASRRKESVKTCLKLVTSHTFMENH